MFTALLRASTHTEDQAYCCFFFGAGTVGVFGPGVLGVGRRTAEERIAALIVKLYKRANALGLVTDGTFAFPLTQQHIADALGLSLVHTNKTLARLRRLGMFTQGNGSLKLTNPRVLAQVAQYFDEEIPLRPLI
jgi:CRP/FNR family transcriptional regulator, anaerobic regulatory protein